MKDINSIQASGTNANPLMIVGIIIFAVPFAMDALGIGNVIIGLLLKIFGAILFMMGLVKYIADMV